MRTHSKKAGRTSLLVGATVVASLALPVAAASAGRLDKSSTFTCPPAAELNFAVGGDYGSPKVGGGDVKGGGTCTYSSGTGGTTYVIAHAPIGHSKLKTLAKAELGHDRIHSESGIGKGAYYGTGKLDVLLVQQGSGVYEALDNSGKSTLKQLEAIVRTVLPK
jgi:hypothetical protein